MHVSVLAAAIALRGAASEDTPTPSPTMSFAPTLTVSPSFAPTGVPLCEPQCEYDYHLTSERMNKKILATVYRFCWILVGMVVFSLGQTTPPKNEAVWIMLGSGSIASSPEALEDPPYASPMTTIRFAAPTIYRSSV